MANLCASCLLLRNTSKILAEAINVSPTRILLNSSHNIAAVSLDFTRNFSVSRPAWTSVRIPRIKAFTVTPQQLKQRKYSADYIQQKIEEYELGVRRLAVMMGENPSTFTKEDVKKAIQYLFPTDLFAKHTRPQMEHPSEVYPPSYRIKADAEGRPYHHLFYMKYPELYQLMNDAYEMLLELQKKEDLQRHNENQPIDLDDSRWMDAKQLKEAILLSRDIDDRTYSQFIAQLERLLEEPYAADCKDFIMKFRIELPKRTSVDIVNKVEKDDVGRQFVCQTGKRKTAWATVKLIAGGKGNITINGYSFDEFFPIPLDREVVITPFTFLKMQRQFDVEATVDGGFSGTWSMLGGQIHHSNGRPKTAMAGAIRLAISRAIVAFVDENQTEQLRRAGLLTYDPRRRERKKPGRKRARKKFKWKKR